MVSASDSCTPEREIMTILYESINCILNTTGKALLSLNKYFFLCQFKPSARVEENKLPFAITSVKSHHH